MQQKIPFYEIFPELNGAGLPRPFGTALVSSVVLDKAHTKADITAELDEAITADERSLAEEVIRRGLGLTCVTLLVNARAGARDYNEAIQKDEIQKEQSEQPRAIMNTAAAPAMPSPARTRIKASAPRKKAPMPVKKPTGAVILGRVPTGTPTPISELTLDDGRATICGTVFAVNSRDIKTGYLLSFDITDNTDSIRIKLRMRGDEAKGVREKIKTGLYLLLSGVLTLDRFENNDIILEPANIAILPSPEARSDDAPEKRVELHLHTKMSAMDAVTDVAEVVRRAKAWGHPAIAITDHGVAHSFPEAYSAAKGEIKVLYGVEGYFINDVDSRPAVFGELTGGIPDEIVAFDIETTGLSPAYDKITEIAAVTIKNGEIISEFHTYANPEMPISQEITKLTGITDDTVKNAPSQWEAVSAFLDYTSGKTFCAHNAAFDIGFIYEAAANNGMDFDPVCFDTLALARVLLPDLANHRLPTVSQALGLAEFTHHRALADTTATAHIMERFAAMLHERGYADKDAINSFAATYVSKSRRRSNHIIIFARTKTGLKNLYRLITDSHLEHFNRYPIIPKSLLERYREGLLIGSACEAGEIWNLVETSSRYEQRRLAGFYDYLEIQPLSNNAFMLRGAKPRAKNDEQLMAWNRRIIELGHELDLPVVATGDVHFLDPEDEIFRQILLCSKDYADALEPLPLHFRTTEEMLDEFAYLGEETAYEIVVTNTRAVADMFDDISPLPPEGKLFSPVIENSAEDLKALVYGRLRDLYGNNPHEIITKRVETELSDILSRNYAVIYMSAQKLVRDSLDHGYLVGSRGSIGSSVVAFFAGITEVNALPPHYCCPKCRNVDFESGHGHGCGADMPDADCPVCGERYKKDGFNIPFETFLGFGGDKVPDIDLNFSGEYQAEAHRRTMELFGEKNVFRAGTIGTVKDRTAFGYVKHYLTKVGKTVSRAEENRLVQGCVGVKRTTGQHPGGLVIIPEGMDITDFCPAQRPADDRESNIITTHFEYHSMEDNLLKLDELGHDDPTMIKMLEDLTGVIATEISLDDPETMRIFKTPEPLGIARGDKIIGETGAIGISEFGTGFTRQMLTDTKPEKFDTLVRLSGYSHGEGVWLGNAKDIILNGIADISETIGCRDDLMQYLISVGFEEKYAFKISESIRKGRGIPDGGEEEMHLHDVPDWYIDSCKTIKYLFPKAHAVAYVMMAFRIAWFKVHRPLAFYSAYFYRRSQKDRFDAEFMIRGRDAVVAKIRELGAIPEKDRTQKDNGLFTTLEACYEFYLRGFEFLPVDIYKSDPVRFTLESETSLRPPLIAVSGLGDVAAYDIDENRRGRSFISIEDFSAICRKVSSAHIESLKRAGAFADMPEESQLSLF